MWLMNMTMHALITIASGSVYIMYADVPFELRRIIHIQSVVPVCFYVTLPLYDSISILTIFRFRKFGYCHHISSVVPDQHYTICVNGLTTTHYLTVGYHHHHHHHHHNFICSKTNANQRHGRWTRHTMLRQALTVAFEKKNTVTHNK